MKLYDRNLRYHPPATPCERALAHSKLSKEIKRRLRETYRGLDPVALLAEIRAAQAELGERIGKRGLAAAEAKQPADPLAFARLLGTMPSTGEVRSTHRRQKHKYKTRVRMPSKLDPHLAMIEGWLAIEPQITALAIVRRLAEIDPITFGDQQHSIVQRLLRTLRKGAAQAAVASTAEEAAKAAAGGTGPAVRLRPPSAPPPPSRSSSSRAPLPPTPGNISS